MRNNLRRLLDEVRAANDHRDGFRSYIPYAGGGKGSNFAKINLLKRVGQLEAEGFVAKTPHGFEITAAGRLALSNGGQS